MCFYVATRSLRSIIQFVSEENVMVYCGKTVVLVCLVLSLAVHARAASMCDFDGDGVCDGTDLYLLLEQGDLVTGVVVDDARFDLTEDGLVNVGDLTVWFREAVDYDARDYQMGGDANLDGTVDRIDLNMLALNWQGSDKVWSQGDFTGDGLVNAADLMTIGSNWQMAGRGTDARTVVNVPEPANWMLLFFAMVLARSLFTKVNSRGKIC